MLWISFAIFFTLRPSDLITIDLRSYGELLSLFSKTEQISVCNEDLVAFASWLSLAGSRKP